MGPLNKRDFVKLPKEMKNTLKYYAGKCLQAIRGNKLIITLLKRSVNKTEVPKILNLKNIYKIHKNKREHYIRYHRISNTRYSAKGSGWRWRYATKTAHYICL